MKTSKSDPCHCGSGLPLGNCHFPIDIAGPQHRPDASRKRYIKGWAENARCFEEQGCYRWMAAQLKPFVPRRIVDIGCGDGRGILALAREFADPTFQLFTLEENPYCISSTRKLLTENEVQVSTVRRCEVVVKAPNTHALLTEHNRLKAEPGVNIFEGDCLADDEAETFLQSQPRFDALTVWLMGTHLVRYECFNLHQLDIRTPGQYRLLVQNKSYDLANRILKIGGVLQIVDRGEIPHSEELQSDIVNGHRQQAAAMKTSLQVQPKIEFLEYAECDTINRVPMFSTPSLSGRVADMQALCIFSVISVKM